MSSFDVIEEEAAEWVRAAREADSPEELGQVLQAVVVMRRILENGWYDVCAAAVEGRPRGFVREAAREAGLGHHLLYRHAKWAEERRLSVPEGVPLYSLRASRRVP